MAKPLDFSANLNEKESVDFVKEIVRLESLPENSPELKKRKKFLNNCINKADRVELVY